MKAACSVAMIGECMVELSAREGGLFGLGFGGDTLNTAVYLARLGVACDYVTVLGDDPWSDRMIAAWAAEGVGTDRVIRLPGRLPGLYVIETDGQGERRFSYWRDTSPARDLFECPAAAGTLAALDRHDMVYLSGISISLYGDRGRRSCFGLLDRLRGRGVRIAFDTNYRVRGWPDAATARAAFSAALERADLVFASEDDLRPMWGEQWRAALLDRCAEAEVVVKLAGPRVHIGWKGTELEVPSEPAVDVLDTTAAGDSFAAAYIAARLHGLAPRQAALAGHRLAGVVVCHRGAIIPRDAMPEMSEITDAATARGNEP